MNRRRFLGVAVDASVAIAVAAMAPSIIRSLAVMPISSRIVKQRQLDVSMHCDGLTTKLIEGVDYEVKPGTFTSSYMDGSGRPDELTVFHQCTLSSIVGADEPNAVFLATARFDNKPVFLRRMPDWRAAISAEPCDVFKGVLHGQGVWRASAGAQHQLMYACPTTTASTGVGCCPNCGYSWSNGDHHDVTPIGPTSFTISCASRPEYFDPPSVTYNYHVWAAAQLLLILLSPMRLWPQARAPPVSLRGP